MKELLTILFSLICLVTFGQTISGRLVDKETNKAILNGRVYLLRPENTNDTTDIYYWQTKKFKILYSTKTDTVGNFTFTRILPRKYTIVADFQMPKIEWLDFQGIVQSIDSNVTIKLNEKYYRTFRLPVTCRFDKTKNQNYCPNCKKTDKVLPIEFGLPMTKFDSLGNLIKKTEVYQAGCIKDLYCNPTKYCKRCKLEF